MDGDSVDIMEVVGWQTRHNGYKTVCYYNNCTLTPGETP